MEIQNEYIFIIDFFQVGSKILNELDNIVTNCSVEKNPSMEKCIVLKIQDYQVSIKELQTSVAKVKNARFSAIKSAKNSARSCNAKIVYAMRVEAIFSVYRDANLCIRSIYKADL